MSDSSAIISALVDLGLFMILASFALAGIKALLMLRGLNVPTYRNQAKGLAGIALYMCFIFLWITFSPSPIGNQALTYACAFVDLGIAVVVMIWIDATVKVARRSDPFERETFHYSFIRYLWFLAVGVPILIGLVYDPLALAVQVSVPTLPAYQAAGYAPYGIAFAFGAILIIVSATRSKDRTFHEHLRWFALFLLCFTATFVLTALLEAFGGGNYQLVGVGGVATYLQFIVLASLAGYFLYRSAGSLALTTSELEPSPAGE